MTQNATCCRPEVAGDVISGKNVKTIECYDVLNFEVASFISFRDIKKNHFVTAAEADIDDSIKRKRIRVSLKKLAALPPYELTTRLICPLCNIMLCKFIFAARRSGSFYSGICHRIRAGRAGRRAETLLEPAK